MEEQKYVYVMTRSISQRQKVPELYYISSTYEYIIKVFYNYHLKEYKEEFLNENRGYFFMDIYKYPMDYDFTYGKITSSKEKMSKSSKHRIKFGDWNELKDEYKKVNRNSQIDNLVD